MCQEKAFCFTAKAEYRIKGYVYAKDKNKALEKIQNEDWYDITDEDLEGPISNIDVVQGDTEDELV